MASVIDPELAKSLIKKYQTQNASQGNGALKTPEDKNLNGFIIDRDSLEAILKDPEITDISISLAKHPDKDDAQGNIYTLVLVGVIASGDQTTPQPYVARGDMYSDVPVCPPWCPKL